MDVVLSALHQLWPGSPGLVLVAVLALVVALRVARALFGSLQRQGARIGALEQDGRAAELRRYQVEASLLAAGIALPPWPAGPFPRDVEPADSYDDETSALPTQHFTRHHLTRRTLP